VTPAAARMPAWLAAFRRILRAIGLVERYLAAATFLAVVALNCAEVAMRYLFRASLWWSQEVSLLMMLVAYFLGASYVFKTRQYVVVDLLVKRFRPRLQVRLYVLAQILIGMVSAVILVQAIGLAPSQLLFNTFILGIPKFYSTVPLLLAALSLMATALYYGIVVPWAAHNRSDAPLSELEADVLVIEGIVPE
jgi:TRAP-type C4-dicarboxylate transport system permease small subunit